LSITFLDKYNPDQFKIIDGLHRYALYDVCGTNEYIQNNRLDYNFNILGLIGVLINYKVKRERYFYCAEFVKYVLEESNICDLPEIIKPEDFKEIDNLHVVYNGVLQEYGN
jgi:hypothetical protein